MSQFRETSAMAAQMNGTSCHSLKSHDIFPAFVFHNIVKMVSISCVLPELDLLHASLELICPGIGGVHPDTDFVLPESELICPEIDAFCLMWKAFH